MRLEGSVVVVTGGTGGPQSIGQALVAHLTGLGATVVAAGRPGDGEPGSTSVPTDVTDPASTAALAEELGRRHQRVDAVVLAAGVTRWRPFEAAEGALEEHLEVNVRGVLRTLQALRPLLGAGSTVLLPSTTWVGGAPAAGMGPYAASKSAAEALLLAWAAELAQAGGASPRVVVARLGPVATPAWSKMGLPPEAVEQAQHWTAVGEGLTRLPTGPEVSGPLAQLLADDAASGVVVVEEAAALRVPAQVQ